MQLQDDIWSRASILCQNQRESRYAGNIRRVMATRSAESIPANVYGYNATLGQAIIATKTGALVAVTSMSEKPPTAGLKCLYQPQSHTADYLYG